MRRPVGKIAPAPPAREADAHGNPLREASRPGGTGRGERAVLALFVTLNLGLLAVFKYANFLVDNLNVLLATAGVEPIELEARAGNLDGEVPPHGTLGRNRQHIPSDKVVGAVAPDDENHAPAWVTIVEAE